MPNKLDWWVRSWNPLRFRWTLDNDSQEVQIKWILIVFLSPCHDRDPPALTLNFKINYGLLHKNEEDPTLYARSRHTLHFHRPQSNDWIFSLDDQLDPWLQFLIYTLSYTSQTACIFLSLHPENCSKCNNKKSVPYTVTYIKRKTQSHTVWWQLIRVYWGVMRGR